jgi:hypothetical protein
LLGRVVGDDRCNGLVIKLHIGKGGALLGEGGEVNTALVEELFEVRNRAV